MSTTDKILGSRNETFKVAGSPELAKTGRTYYTLTDYSTSPATITVKSKGATNVFDRSVGTLNPETGAFTKTKGSDDEVTFFSGMGIKQAINASKTSSKQDLMKNKNPNFEGSGSNNVAAVDKTINNGMKTNVGTESSNGIEDKRPVLKDTSGASARKAVGRDAAGTKNSGFGTHVYPKTLRQDRDGQDYLKFQMMKYIPRDFDSNTFSFTARDKDFDKRTIGNVILPIPSGIADAQATSWGGESMTPLDMAKANVALTTVGEGVTAGINEVGNQARKIGASFGDNRDALAAVIAGMAAGGQQLLTRTTGAIANPNMELLFNGPNLRTFSFQFLLAPRDDSEARTIIQILRFFKQGMAPIRTKSRLFLKSPHTFKLSYRNNRGRDHKYLNKFKECALQSFGVNYAPNGTYSTYEDGVMTAYQMTMTYQELTPIYNDDYGPGNPIEVGF